MRCNNPMSKPFANDCGHWGGLKTAICGSICVGEVLVPIGCVVSAAELASLSPDVFLVGQQSGLSERCWKQLALYPLYLLRSPIRLAAASFRSLARPGGNATKALAISEP